MPLPRLTSPHPVSDHCDGRRFFNPAGLPPAGLKAIWDWRRHADPAPWPERFASPYPQDRPPARVTDGLRLTHIGHSGNLLQTAGLNLLVDPQYSERCSPSQRFGPKRHAEPGVAFEHLPPIDVVLISHSHYDHMDRATLTRLHDVHRPRFVAPLGVDAILRGWRHEARAEAYDWHETVALGDGLAVMLWPAHHWSARGAFDRCRTLWASFALETPAGFVFHAGDTGFNAGRDYAAAREAFGPAALAVLPIGAYEPRAIMKPQHQEPDEAVRGALLLEAALTVGVHWGYFQLTDEAIDDPLRRLALALETHGLAPARFVAARPGLVVELPAAGT
ncbi:MBL fold metallo-hydrolase [Aurantimonas sp. MSK8Z-1]|uniref:MBL fold metallo-hydrolase n=1 Tax=Mangrovibrevibacter kandeliae TaxID=2968473 RepID=UPI002118B6C2|nr:MBL fold metallo-hydrolase [Aurantimonas sp. MSK8Z-1]MCW4116354.1 MBL fold metallo-hydrolase [Aurantimonas sp. MSK8Z-1]